MKKYVLLLHAHFYCSVDVHVPCEWHLKETALKEDLHLHIKTHDSESRGQEETAIIRETKNTRPLSELFTRKSVKKL